MNILVLTVLNFSRFLVFKETITRITKMKSDKADAESENGNQRMNDNPQMHPNNKRVRRNLSIRHATCL